MKKGELWILELPFIDGKEQRGTRPGLVIADTKTGMIIVIPLTSNLQALRFPHTVEIRKSLENGLEKDSIALIFQMQSLDGKRFLNKIGEIENTYIEKTEKLVRELLQL